MSEILCTLEAFPEGKGIAGPESGSQPTDRREHCRTYDSEYWTVPAGTTLTLQVKAVAVERGRFAQRVKNLRHFWYSDRGGSIVQSNSRAFIMRCAH